MTQLSKEKMKTLFSARMVKLTFKVILLLILSISVGLVLGTKSCFYELLTS